MDKRITLVSGASRGIGYFAALALAEAGHHVIATARTQGALEELDDAIQAAGGTCSLVPLDLRDFDSIDRLGAALNDRYGRLDGLFANAGVLGPITPAGHVTPKDWMQVMDVNATANYRLIRALDPLLRESQSGRALFVTTSPARAPRAYWGAYAASKAAMEVFAMSWADELENVTPVRVNLLNPGAVRTQMRAKAVPGENPETLPHPRELSPLIVDMLSGGWAETGQLVSYRNWAASA